MDLKVLDLIGIISAIGAFLPLLLLGLGLRPRTPGLMMAS